jgi:hypothetical protein
MTIIKTKRLKPKYRKVFLAVLLMLLIFGLVLGAVELVRPGLVRGKMYTTYFAAKAATWEWEYPSGMPDTSAIDRVVTVFLAPEIARMPAKTWREGASETIEVFLPQSSGGPLPADLFQTPLISSAGEWKYQDDGLKRNPDWYAPEHDDSFWKTGQTPLAFAVGNVSTQLAKNEVTTIYLRRAFTVEEPSLYQLLDLQLMTGGEAAVYLNGNEVFHAELQGQTTGIINLLLMVW